jgi:predicted ester cyclase
MSSPQVIPLQDRNKTLIRSYIDEIFNKHNLSSIERYFGENYVGGSLQVRRGGVGSKHFINEFFKAFPDWHITIEHTVAENDLVLVFLNGSGTHKGEFHGTLPTNKQANIRSAELYKIVKGRISGHWYVFDQLDLLKQTGVSLSGKNVE